MKFKEFGDANNPSIILLHGGGLSWWSLQAVIDGLRDEYHVVAPVIDGHGEDGGTLFTSIEDSAGKVLRYIDTHCGGQVFAIGGLSVGAQIALEVLASKKGVAHYAIIESALVFPMKAAAMFTVPVSKISYGLISKKWFSSMQAKALFVPDGMTEQYYADSLKISKQSLVNLTLSNSGYTIKETLRDINTKTMIVAGGKELGIMRKSARALHNTIPGSRLYIMEKLRHGELSQRYPQRYLSMMKSLFNAE